MQLLFIKQWLTTELVQALCWTLVHSLWQGLLLAIVAGGIILFTRKSGPALRYNLLAALFLMFLVAVSSTFVMELGNANKSTQSIAANALQLTDGSLTLPVQQSKALHKKLRDKYLPKGEWTLTRNTTNK